MVFRPTSVSNKDGMLNKIMRFKVKKHNDLFGIDLAYSMAKENYEDNGRNLVIIVRDGENFVAGLEIDTQNEGEGRFVKTGVVISALGLLPGLINAIKN